MALMILDADQVVTPADQPILLVRRRLRAPQALVFKMYSDPRHLVHFWGPHGSSNPVCSIDFRVGGIWHQVMRFADGNEYATTSMYTEIRPSELIAYRDAPAGATFGQDFPPANVVTTLAFEDLGGETELRATVTFNSVAARDQAAQMGFAQAIVQSNERLSAYLAQLGSQDD